MRQPTIITAFALCTSVACGPGEDLDDEAIDESELAALDPNLIELDDTAIAARAHLLPGDRFQHPSIPIALHVPPLGTGVFGEVMRVDGRMEEVRVETRADGTVHVRSSSDAAVASASSSAPPRACDDRARHLATWHWSSTFQWSFDASTTPNEITADGAETALRHAATNITRSDNNCGLEDRVSATHAYQGRTARSPSIGANGECGSPDGFNVVAFGDLPAGTLGLTCSWYNLENGEAVESDVRLNAAAHAWIVELGSGCTNRFHVESVMTHEFGHVFGLAHVSESLHGRLTMSPQAAPCQRSEATLGRGDVLGLRSKY